MSTHTAQPSPLNREMGCTPTELLGWLPQALAPWSYRVQGAGAQVCGPDGVTLRLHWQALAPRRLGAISLPRLALCIDWGAATPAQQGAFLARWDLYTRRGGG